MSACLQRNDLIIILSNVLFFMVVQTLFFVLVASKQYETVLVSKIDLVKAVYSKFPNIKQSLIKTKNKYVQDNSELVSKQSKARKKENEHLIWKFCGVPIVVTLVAMAYLFLFSKSREPWSDVDTLGLMYVVLGYLTELCFFFFIVRKYEFVGDQYIVSNVSQNLII
jgi:hypothetical protein